MKAGHRKAFMHIPLLTKNSPQIVNHFTTNFPLLLRKELPDCFENARCVCRDHRFSVFCNLDIEFWFVKERLKRINPRLEGLDSCES